MKYKALLLSLLILLPLVAFAFPANADITGPVLFVSPNLIKKKGPCLVSTTFDVEVKLWNKEELTQVGVYAYDFTLAWPNSTRVIDDAPSTANVTLCPPDVTWPFTSLISLVSYEYTSPWDHFYVIADDLELDIDDLTPDGYDEFHLAITALDGSDPLVEVQTVLLKMTFHIDCEPLWPDQYWAWFDLRDASMAEAMYKDPLTGIITTTPIDIFEVDDGWLKLYMWQPDVYITPEAYCEYKIGMPHEVNVFLSHINKAYGFGFGVTFNNTLLKADIQSIDICDMFPPPYEDVMMKVVNLGNGFSQLQVVVVRPCEKPTVTHQPGPVATFSLLSTFTPLTIYGDLVIPTCYNSTITLDWAFMLSKCGCRSAYSGAVQYYYGNVLAAGYNPLPGAKLALLSTIDPLTGESLNLDIDYYWRPRIGDLNLDGAVDIQDLDALADVYGLTLGTDPDYLATWPDWGHLDNFNAIVDIYDFVIVAKFFGKPHECIIDTDLAPVCWPN